MVVPAGPLALDISRFPSNDSRPGVVGLGWRLGWEMRISALQLSALLSGVPWQRLQMPPVTRPKVAC